MNSKTIIGPYWFQDAGVKSVIINKENYRINVHKFCSSVNRRRGINMDQQCFTQNDATPPIPGASLKLLKQKFGDRVISRRTEYQMNSLISQSQSA